MQKICLSGPITAYASGKRQAHVGFWEKGTGNTIYKEIKLYDQLIFLH